MPGALSLWPPAEMGFARLWSVYICQAWCRLAAEKGCCRLNSIIQNLTVCSKFGLAVRGEAFSKGDKIRVSPSLSWEGWYRLGGCTGRG